MRMEITPAMLQAALEEWRGLWDKGEGEFLEAEAKAYKARTGMDPPEGWPALRDNVDAREYSLVVEPLLWELLAKAFKAQQEELRRRQVCRLCGMRFTGKKGKLFCGRSEHLACFNQREGRGTNGNPDPDWVPWPDRSLARSAAAVGWTSSE